MKRFCILGVFLTIFLAGCSHLQVDEFPTGLGDHPNPLVNIPAHVGAGIGLAGGIPLSLALLPVTLPCGYLYNDSGGAFAFAVYPSLIFSYTVGAIFGFIPYFLSLPFADSPLQDSHPERRFRAIQWTGWQKSEEYLPQLYSILQKDVPENQVEAAKALGKIGSPQSIPELLKIFRQSQDPYTRYSCFMALVEMASSKNTSLWIEMTRGKERLEVEVAMILLAKIKDRDALNRLVDMLEGPHSSKAHELLRKATKESFAPDPKIWRDWLNAKK